MLRWQQNQREDFHMHLLGQAVLDEKHGIIPPLPLQSTAASSSQACPQRPFGRRASGHLPDGQNFLFRACPIAALPDELAAFGLPGGIQAVVDL